jgi:hypothetical protein
VKDLEIKVEANPEIVPKQKSSKFLFHNFFLIKTKKKQQAGISDYSQAGLELEKPVHATCIIFCESHNDEQPSDFLGQYDQGIDVNVKKHTFITFRSFVSLLFTFLFT